MIAMTWRAIYEKQEELIWHDMTIDAVTAVKYSK